jgi:hypothetical protein
MRVAMIKLIKEGTKSTSRGVFCSQGSFLLPNEANEVKKVFTSERVLVKSGKYLLFD